MIYSVRPSWFMRKLYPSALWRVKQEDKKIYLTFDDGPVPEVTPQVLSILKEHNAKATFFCVGENIEKHPDIFWQVIAGGHSAGNHTHNHLNGWHTRTKKYMENMELCNSRIRESVKVAAGESGSMSHFPAFPLSLRPLFRPPYGCMTPMQYKQAVSHFNIVMWDVLSGDFDRRTAPQQCLAQTLARTRSGSIVVFHDSIKAQQNLFYTLPRFLSYFSERGYVFEGLSERTLGGVQHTPLKGN